MESIYWPWNYTPRLTTDWAQRLYLDGIKVVIRTNTAYLIDLGGEFFAWCNDHDDCVTLVLFKKGPKADRYCGPEYGKFSLVSYNHFDNCRKFVTYEDLFAEIRKILNAIMAKKVKILH